MCESPFADNVKIITSVYFNVAVITFEMRADTKWTFRLEWNLYLINYWFVISRLRNNISPDQT